MNVSEKQVLHFLGYKGAKADEGVSALIQDLTDELTACVTPKSVCGIWDCQVEPPVVSLMGMRIHSQGLSAHLEGCRRAAVFAATLGTGADLLIRKYSVSDIGKAVVAGAVCAAMIEEYCDRMEAEIAREEEVCGQYRTARFSPGYGDFELSHQKDILRLLNCGKRIGLTLTDGMMLIPSKSVVAVIGFRQEKTDSKGKCENCTHVDCALREATQ